MYRSVDLTINCWKNKNKYLYQQAKGLGKDLLNNAPLLKEFINNHL